MGMIFILEVISLFFGIFLFRIEVIKLRCKNFIPSMFLLIYVPLFCITPILYHFLTNGAISIDHKADGYVFTDPRIQEMKCKYYNIDALINKAIINEEAHSSSESDDTSSSKSSSSFVSKSY
jgi:hypothetical protein